MSLRVAVFVGALIAAVSMPMTVGSSAASPQVSPDLPTVTITLGAPRQLFHFRQPDAMGLFNVPDMHVAFWQRPDKAYWLWISGNIGPVPGAVARLSSPDFLRFENAGPNRGGRAEPVLAPSCRTPNAPQRGRGRGGRGAGRGTGSGRATRTESCIEDYDADYVGANSVIAADNGRDLLMFYEAGNKTAGTTTIEHGWEYNVMALARSTDDGITWKREGVILTGTDPKPASRTRIAQPGISEPGALVVDGYIYMFYQYIANEASANARSIIQAARAPLATNGIPGTWKKYFEGSFSEAGLGGRGSAILSTERSGCTRPVQVSPVRSSYLGAYVLTYLCDEGWFFSTSTDLINWTPPTNFMPMTMWQNCEPMDWNFTLATPGNPAGVIGQKGYVLYAHSDAKGLGCGGRFSPHMLWSRPFEFSRNVAASSRGVPSSERPAPVPTPGQ